MRDKRRDKGGLGEQGPSGGSMGPGGHRDSTGPGGHGDSAGPGSHGDSAGPGGNRGPMGPGGHKGPMGPGRNRIVEKPKNFTESWKKLIQYCRKYLPFILIATILAIVGAICALIGPDRMSKITDLVTQGLFGEIDLEGVKRIAFSLVLLYGISALFSYLQSFIMGTLTQYVSRQFRKDISMKINRVPLSYFDRTSFGDVLSRVTNDVDTIGQTMSQSIATLASAVTMLLGTLFMMFYTNWIMAFTAVFATCSGFIFMVVIMKNSQKHFVAQQKELGRLNGHIEEIYTGHDVVKAYSGEKAAIKTFKEINDKLYESAWKSQFLSGLMMPVMSFIGNFGYVAVCVVGAALAMNGNITFGVIVAFMMYVRLFTNPLNQIAQAMNSLQSTAAAGERVFEFLEEKEMEDEKKDSLSKKKLETAKGDVEFRNVQFGYTEDKVIIHDFSARAEAGQKVAIVGPTGAGKTTMVNLLMRFYELKGGDILIDGISTKELTRENVHDLFCMVLQDTWLFEGTIRENIVYSKEGVSEGDVQRACKAAGIDHFIHTLPQGYDTVLNDKANLSAGQKQLITIARAMVENAPLLILDEATSSVDTRTEVQIQNAMDKLTKGRTSFVIAHRLSTIRNADLILVMKDGDIVESGKHEELLMKGGFYAELYQSQFESA